MHGHRDGPCTTGHEIIDDRRHRIDGDFLIKTFPRLSVDHIGHEIFGAETFLDVRQIVIGSLDEISALAPRGRRLRVAVRG